MSKTRRNIVPSSNGHATNRVEAILSPKPELVPLFLKKPVQALTENQKKYLQAIESNDVTIVTSCAGTGKTTLAIGSAISYLAERRVDKIVIARPMVHCDEDVGFLPGDLQDKLNPYLRPIVDELGEFITAEQMARLMSGKIPIIEGVPLGLIKGRNFKRSFVILDEAQDATYKQLKSFITRMGLESKVIITGDLSQSDRFVDHQKIPLWKIMDRLKNVPRVGIVTLGPEDIQRHPLLNHILKKL
jgi:phosphate starvation-inducible protein PhoH and related proteins